MRYKVPFRQVYCGTLKDWAKQTFWCHVVIKVFPHCTDLGSDGLVSSYIDNPKMFYDQYEWRLRDISGLSKKVMIE